MSLAALSGTVGAERGVGEGVGAGREIERRKRGEGWIGNWHLV